MLTIFIISCLVILGLCLNELGNIKRKLKADTEYYTVLVDKLMSQPLPGDKVGDKVTELELKVKSLQNKLYKTKKELLNLRSRV